MKINSSMKAKIKEIGLEKILEYSPAGIHVIDKDYNTILYNDAMAKLEGLDIEKVFNGNFFEVFPNLNKENSTLISVMKHGEKIVNRLQTYENTKGKEITTINTTIPIIDGNRIIGALEIANNMTHMREMSDNILNLKKEIQKNHSDCNISRYTFEDLIGEHGSFINTKKIAKMAGNSSSSVLIYGETGTGKELFAQSIHYCSERNKEPFIAQNCAAIPDTLLEGILFGTEKGSFTGAISTKGIFEQANGGTLLLDEINSMSIELQAKLLRVLQESYIRRIGGKKDIPIDVRIIATTNQNPSESLQNGIIRKDLFYRLSVISITIPLLKDRITDIPILVNHFIDKFNKKLNKNVKSVSDEILNNLYNYDWPGNVRELENIIEAAMNLVDKNTEILSRDYFITSNNFITKSFIKDIELEKESLPDYMDRLEKDLIKDRFLKNNKNISKTAKELGISRQSLQYKIKKYKLE